MSPQMVHTSFKGHLVTLHPGFPTPFYEEFATRCAAQLHEVLTEYFSRSEEPIGYIEVQPGLALVHPLNKNRANFLGGELCPEYPTEVVIVCWKGQSWLRRD